MARKKGVNKGTGTPVEGEGDLFFGVIRRDGAEVYRSQAYDNAEQASYDAFARGHRLFGYSWDHAERWEGWRLVVVREGAAD